MSRTIFFFQGLQLWCNSCKSVESELIDYEMFLNFKIMIIYRLFNFFAEEEAVKSMGYSTNSRIAYFY